MTKTNMDLNRIGLMKLVVGKTLREQLEDTRIECNAEAAWHRQHARRADLFEQDLADALSDDSARRERAAKAYSDVLDARVEYAKSQPGGG